MIQNPHSDSLFHRPDASPPPVQPAKRRLRTRTRSGAESLPVRKRNISVRADASRCLRCSCSANTAGREAHSCGFHRLEGEACGDGRPARPAAWFRTVIRFRSSNPCARVRRSSVVRAGTSASQACASTSSSRIRTSTACTPPRIEPQGEGGAIRCECEQRGGNAG